MLFRHEHVTPRVSGTDSSLSVSLPVPDTVLSLLPLSSPPATPITFHVTPVFFNIGINERATLAELLGATKPQERSNVDNFGRLNQYYHRFRKLNIPSDRRGMYDQRKFDLIFKYMSIRPTPLVVRLSVLSALG